MKKQLLIPAAGLGQRLGNGAPKALRRLSGHPLIVHTLRRFEAAGVLAGAVIVVPPGQRDVFAEALHDAFPSLPFRFVDGGAERQLSVEYGLDALDTDTEFVAIHDAARPFVTREAIAASFDAAAVCGAATVAIPSIDTVLVSDAEGYLVDTPDRSRLWACQTPQTFRVEVIRAAHAAAREKGETVTDDATLVMRRGGLVRLVPGSPLNFKVTTPEDLKLASLVMENGLA